MKIFKKIVPLALALSMVLSSFTPVLAEVNETQNVTENTTSNTEVIYNQESLFGVTIPKKITLDSDKTSTYEIIIEGDISSDEEILVVPDESFLMKDQALTGTKKADVTATVTQDKTRWFFHEFEIKGNGLIEAYDLTSGNWAGQFFFNISLNDNTHVCSEYEENITKDATCLEDGSKEKTCIECGNVISETIPATGHDYETSSTASNCTEEGYTTYTCKRCSDSYVDDTVPAMGHSYSDWETVTEATCTEDGSKEKTCTACGDVVTETITTTGHNYSDWNTSLNPTCTIVGSQNRTCSICGDVETKEVAVLGHDWNTDYTIDKEATCTEEGSKSIHCSRCSAIKDTATIPVIDHTPMNGGTEDIHEKCSICEITLSTNHNDTLTVEKAANCIEDGSIKHHCNCGYDWIEVVPASHNIVAGECTKCDYNIPGLYNENGDLIVIWEESGTDVEKEYSLSSYKTDTTSPYYVITNYYPTTTKVIIPEGVTRIGDYAFYGCKSLTSITITEGVTSIGDYVFNNCSGLTSITVDSNNPVYDSRNNCNAIIKTATNELIRGCNTTVIPDTVTSIGNSAFYGCTDLTSITIPEGVTSIGDYAFYGCTSLTSITIPENVTSIGDYAFRSCSSLTSITVDSNNPVYDSRNNCNAIIKTATNELIRGCNTTVIPDTVTSIGSYSFDLCSSLTSITIPEGVTSIGIAAFNACSRLTSITIPNTVTSISSSVFFGCVRFRDVYYEGSEEDWSKISISLNGNSSLTNATIHYNYTE